MYFHEINIILTLYLIMILLKRKILKDWRRNGVTTPSSAQVTDSRLWSVPSLCSGEHIYSGALNYCCGNCSLMQSRTIVPHVLSLQPQKSFYKEREWEGKGGTALE